PGNVDDPVVRVPVAAVDGEVALGVALAIADRLGAAVVAATATRARPGGLDRLPLVEDLAGAGIDEEVHLGRGLVGLDAVERHLVRQLRGNAAAREHDLARGRGADEAAAEMGAGLNDRLVAADAGAQAGARAGLQGLGHAGELAVARSEEHTSALQS